MTAIVISFQWLHFSSSTVFLDLFSFYGYDFDSFLSKFKIFEPRLDSGRIGSNRAGSGQLGSARIRVGYFELNRIELAKRIFPFEKKKEKKNSFPCKPSLSSVSSNRKGPGCETTISSDHFVFNFPTVSYLATGFPAKSPIFWLFVGRHLDRSGDQLIHLWS